ncbi:MAG TPA: MFS transporter [Streptosporangiaceae bacterium]|jgi:predicted MFS family arabinose efflux permease
MSLAVVLRRPYVPWLVTSGLVGRLPTGMTALALVLLVRGRGADYSLAGALAAAYGVGGALGGPALGRLVDRTRQPPVLYGAALVAAVAFAGVALAGPGRPLLAGVAALVAGVATPPLEPCMRALWPGLLAGTAPVQTAYAFDAAAQELIFTAGPLVVLGGVALAGPEGGVWAAALIGLAGAAAFASAPPSRTWRATPVPDVAPETGGTIRGTASAAPGRTRHWAGPLRSRGLRRLLGALAGVGATIGVGTVAFPGVAEALGNRSMGGWLLAANAVGAFAGGVGYGALPVAAAPRRRLLPLVGLFALGYLPLAFPVPLALAVVLAVVSGVMLPPVLACAFMAVDELAPAGTVTEAFAWVVTAFQIGSALGAAIAGRVVQDAGPGRAFAVGVALACVATLVVAVRRPPKPPAPRP